MTTIPEIPEEQVTSEMIYYHGFYVMLNFNKEAVFEMKEEQANVDQDPDEEETEDVKLDNERERHWRMFLEDNDRGVDDKKELLHAKRWDVYMDEK